MTIPPIDCSWFIQAIIRQSQLTMPLGALGRLLELGRKLCVIQQTLQPQAEPAAVVVLVADHGIAEEKVSAYPQKVTAQMLRNFLAGGAAINVLARRVRSRVLVANLGVKERFVIERSTDQVDYLPEEWTWIGPGTVNFLHGPAMTPEQAECAITVGRRIVQERLHDCKVVALGEMGIGNTTSASALAAVLTGRSVEAVTGRGTGLDEAGWRRKVNVIRQAIRRHFPAGDADVKPQDALAAVGGFEIAGLVGVALEAAAQRKLVVLDGFISSVAGLLACRFEPQMRNYCVAAHRSVEAGHGAVLEALGLEPLFELDLRLGEGSGAVLALPFLQAAADILRDMATFTEAEVLHRA